MILGQNKFKSEYFHKETKERDPKYYVENQKFNDDGPSNSPFRNFLTWKNFTERM